MRYAAVGHRALLLATLVAASSCSRVQRNEAFVTKHAIPVGEGISVPTTGTLSSLPREQWFRFVAPSAIVRGATPADDAASAPLLQARVRTLLESQGWRESAELAEYDLAVFDVNRTRTRTEVREEPVISDRDSGLPRCDGSRDGKQPPCADSRRMDRTKKTVVQVPVPYSKTITVIRRRSDGAIALWMQDGSLQDARTANVTRDLARMFATTAER